ncbi:LOW QUALITY PROTEIN: evolutionarily conserved signaling intermediate in Toll pathway, mitochondrial [Ammospiza caudacuta]|uniref:LOW QUALITY PROTEIN: evolutionarily conserved signaling intermediate in Toll pathway, mitochondrial n=1 Tax=Ammospiza caudacuta TaxID=2857398 RepID=UPI0027397EF3|nr:LOW QUALITY PROTEIN: evolutionarily conserved signaling intermediate in Toll pathway, mitochondrial [Ammospiza caudacuta]
MRLGWLRALPRRLWGGPAAPELCRSLCQRPARVPAEGSDTNEGTPKPRRAPSRDPAEGDGPRGDTSGGDTSGGDTSGGATPKPPLRRLLRSRGSHHEHTHTGDTGDAGGRSDPGAAFEAALRELSRAPPGRGGRLALVEAALAALPALGAERSLGAYNALLRLLPRGAWVPRGPVQRLLFPFPRQQECGLRLLEQMEQYGVMPDAETRFLLLGVFGPRSRPMRKLQRMQFWLPRMRHLDPHPQPPRPLPPGLEAARLGLQRMACDPGAIISVIQAPVPDSGDDEGSVQPFIISCQSPDQQELLAQHGPARPVFVEGPFPLWLRGTLLKYFVLRGDPLPPHIRDPPPDPERSFYFPLHLELELERSPWDDDDFHDVDRVEEGPVLALCMAGGAQRPALARWIAALQERNPALANTPVIFRLHPGMEPGAEPPPRARLGQGSPPGTGLEPPEGREPGGEPPKTEGNKRGV